MSSQFMTPKLLIATFLLPLGQLVVFVGVWSLALEIARATGISQRPDLAFGMTLHYGLILIGFLFQISSFPGILSSRRIHQWIAVLSCLAVWAYWMMPSFDSHPLRGPLFFLIGASLLLLGGGILAPRLRRWILKNPADTAAGQRQDVSNVHVSLESS